VLRRKFGPKIVEVTEKWRRLHNEELNDRVTESTRMRWAGYVARMGERRHVYTVLVGKPEGKRTLEDADVDGRIILKWIFRNRNGSID